MEIAGEAGVFKKQLSRPKNWSSIEEFLPKRCWSLLLGSGEDKIVSTIATGEKGLAIETLNSSSKYWKCSIDEDLKFKELVPISNGVEVLKEDDSLVQSSSSTKSLIAL